MGSFERAETIKIQEHMRNVTIILNFAQGVSYEWTLTAENFDKYLLEFCKLWSDKLKPKSKHRTKQTKEHSGRKEITTHSRFTCSPLF